MLERDVRLILWTVGTVHDAIVMDIPKTDLSWVPTAVRESFEVYLNGVFFPLTVGPAADDWFRCAH